MRQRENSCAGILQRMFIVFPHIRALCAHYIHFDIVHIPSITMAVPRIC